MHRQKVVEFHQLPLIIVFGNFCAADNVRTARSATRRVRHGLCSLDAPVQFNHLTRAHLIEAIVHVAIHLEQPLRKIGFTFDHVVLLVNDESDDLVCTSA